MCHNERHAFQIMKFKCLSFRKPDVEVAFTQYEYGMVSCFFVSLSLSLSLSLTFSLMQNKSLNVFI
jgi:hypothetical protein